jgi:hypothetical protein
MTSLRLVKRDTRWDIDPLAREVTSATRCRSRLFPDSAAPPRSAPTATRWSR